MSAPEAETRERAIERGDFVTFQQGRTEAELYWTSGVVRAVDVSQAGTPVYIVEVPMIEGVSFPRKPNEPEPWLMTYRVSHDQPGLQRLVRASEKGLAG